MNISELNKEIKLNKTDQHHLSKHSSESQTKFCTDLNGDGAGQM